MYRMATGGVAGRAALLRVLRVARLPLALFRGLLLDLVGSPRARRPAAQHAALEYTRAPTGGTMRFT
jgi:hypothetical protein